MTIFDILCLAELWVNLSANTPGVFVEELTLPGELTNRSKDRLFKCIKLDSCPDMEPEEWREYLENFAVDHIDFKEIIK